MLQCELCGCETEGLQTIDGFLNCEDCVYSKLREGFRVAKEEWDNRGSGLIIEND